MVRQKTHCKYGHVLNDLNIYIQKNGKRHCRACNKERAKKWSLKNKKLVVDRAKSWYKNNLIKAKETRKKYRENNKEKITKLKREYKRRKRSRLKNQLGTWEVPEHLAEFTLYVQQQGLCFYCNKSLNEFTLKKYHLEHKIPLSRGGLHSWFNVVLSCPPCNLSKLNKTPAEFLKWRVV